MRYGELAKEGAAVTGGLYVRRVLVGIVLGALFLPHWVPALRRRGDEPLYFVLGLTLLVGYVLWRALRSGRTSVGT